MRLLPNDYHQPSTQLSSWNKVQKTNLRNSQKVEKVFQCKDSSMSYGITSVLCRGLANIR